LRSVVEMSDPLSQVFAALTDPTRRDLAGG